MESGTTQHAELIDAPLDNEPIEIPLATHTIPEAAKGQLQLAFQAANQASLSANNFAAGVLSGMGINTIGVKVSFSDDYSSVTLEPVE